MHGSLASVVRFLSSTHHYLYFFLCSKQRIIKLVGGGDTLNWRYTRRCRAGTRFCAKGSHGTTRPSSSTPLVEASLVYHMEWCCSRILVVNTAEVSSAVDVKHGVFSTTVTTRDCVLAFSTSHHLIECAPW